LSEKGYSSVASELERASNVTMEEPSVVEFRQKVLRGDFKQIPTLVKNLIKSKSQESSASRSALVLKKSEFL
jgi:hypothetical protein